MHSTALYLLGIAALAAPPTEAPGEDRPRPRHAEAGRPGLPPGPPPGMHRPGPGMEAGPGLLPEAHALALTAPQRQALEALHAKYRPSLEAARKAAHDKEGALHDAAREPGTPEATLKSLHADATEARWQALLAHRAAGREALALLDPGQKARLQRIQARQKALREAERGLRDELGPPPERPGGTGGPRR